MPAAESRSIGGTRTSGKHTQRENGLNSAFPVNFVAKVRGREGNLVEVPRKQANYALVLGRAVTESPCGCIMRTRARRHLVSGEAP